MIDTNERPPFDDAVTFAALEKLLDAGRVRDVSVVLQRYTIWAAQLADAGALTLKGIEERLRILREIESTHGDGAAMNLEHPAMIRELNRHAHKPFSERRHASRRLPDLISDLDQKPGQRAGLFRN
jgi:hypothetical protein